MGQYLKELKIRYINTRKKLPVSGVINKPEDVYQLFKDTKYSDKEKLISLHLNSRMEINCMEHVSLGSTNCLLFSPKEVFKGVLLSNSEAFILIHNHPTGNPTPSDQDLGMCHDIQKYAPHIGLTMIDCVIIGDTTYWSMKENREEDYTGN